MVATVLLGAGAVVGCGASAVRTPLAAPVASAAVTDDARAGLMEHHRHHHGGVTLWIAMSLDTLGVSPEQRVAVEVIRTDLLARSEAARAAEQHLLAALADGLAATSFDAAKVDADVARVIAAVAAVHDASAAALNHLHAVLTRPQRAALVEKVEAHWAVWQTANTEESIAASANGGHLATLATDLGLTPDQADRIRAALGARMKAVPRLDPQAVAMHLRAFGEAFRHENFDARTLTTARGADAHLVGWGAARMARLVEAVSPLLAPDQRATFAQRLREHAIYNPSAEGNQ
ncbi:MAG TPA: Spy/CpxP family protein refolding chaperone [Polyangia bacterium]|jgi:Spy/CpxP family protein refolding chaperone